jgi:hypothetical protein
LPISKAPIGRAKYASPNVPKVISSDAVELPTRKEHLRNRHGKISVGDEIEPFQDVADRRRDHHALEALCSRHSPAERRFDCHPPLLFVSIL